MKTMIHIDGGWFDESLIPPQRVIPSETQCNHTPCPEGYLQWQEWATQASKTHSQINCPHCGKYSIWLPKAEAKPINAAYRKMVREVAKAVKREHKKREKEAMKK